MGIVSEKWSYKMSYESKNQLFGGVAYHIKSQFVDTASKEMERAAHFAP